MQIILVMLVVLTVLCSDNSIAHRSLEEMDHKMVVVDAQTKNSTAGKLLSRKKRYLTFPVGSSLQLVYCLTMPVLGQGNIFTMGGTAAVAWQLPTDSFITLRKKFRNVIKERTEKIIAMMQAAQAKKAAAAAAAANKRNDYATNQYHKQTQSSEKPVYKFASQNSYPAASYPHYSNQSSYYNYDRTYNPLQSYQSWKSWANPNSKKPQYNYNRNSQSTSQDDYGYGRQHSAAYKDDYNTNRQYSYKDEYNSDERSSPYNNNAYSSNRRTNANGDDYLDYDKEYENQFHKEIHRRSRRELYSKIEKFFIAQNKDGKSCLLKAICEVSQTSENELGSFVQEILKAIFTVKSHEHLPNENDEYDRAANKKHNCTEQYPKCVSSVWNIF